MKKTLLNAGLITLIIEAVIAVILFVLWLLIMNSPSLVSGNFHLVQMIKDLFADNDHLVFLAILLLSAMVLFLLQIANRLPISKKAFLISLLIGEVYLIVSTCLLGASLKSICAMNIEYENGAAYALQYSFGSIKALCCWTSLLLCVFYLADRIWIHMELLCSNPYTKAAFHHTATRDNPAQSVLFLAIPSWLLLCATWTVEHLLHIPVSILVPTVSALVVVIKFVARIRSSLRLSIYFAEVAKCTDPNRTLVRIREPMLNGNGLFTVHFWGKKRIMNQLREENILFLPESLAQMQGIDDLCLDFYHDQNILEDRSQYESAIDLANINRGVFCIAFLDTFHDNLLSNAGDTVVSSSEAAVEKLRYYSNLLHYKVKQTQILSTLQIEKLHPNTLLSEEILSFSSFFDSQLNQFQIFDHNIKWLETCNYFFALVIISALKLPASSTIHQELEDADFSRWRKIRKYTFSDSALQHSLCSPVQEQEVFFHFDYVWNAVTSRNYSFSVFSTDELLDAANALRDYTRGHGVFTFEISQEINLALLEVVIFLLNRLIDAITIMTDGGKNLLTLGWIKEEKNRPFFLYSCNPRVHEDIFQSFRDGSSLMFSY